jgi:hypothetical protein
MIGRCGIAFAPMTITHRAVPRAHRRAASSRGANIATMCDRRGNRDASDRNVAKAALSAT